MHFPFYCGVFPFGTSIALLEIHAVQGWYNDQLETRHVLRWAVTRDIAMLRVPRRGNGVDGHEMMLVVDQDVWIATAML